MALDPSPLGRAVRAARADEPAGWVDLAESIMARVRRVVVPSEPILTFTEQGISARDEQGSATFVSARVVSAALRRLLQEHPTHAPDNIELHVDEGRLTGIDIRLVARYGVELHPLADTLRPQILDIVTTLLGPAPGIDLSAIEIEYVDVTRGDPNRT
ncbi:hypothetical protein NBCG_01887 [Nocardioidaceae bacterium Broad-1]|uniref:hypothetical protein n=1 Tax=Nocardioides luteus TaxID=1844 RepID=UPI00020290AD|nr:hypothetical protein [Nocardioides luteus]EGD43760.1 hypothetical protein NBCG_01887 [Nocardioidaceae bacterium Broad-1]MBG6095636.1 putative alkaline shock family protein YloU [Nocardioides luteus]